MPSFPDRCLRIALTLFGWIAVIGTMLPWAILVVSIDALTRPLWPKLHDRLVVLTAAVIGALARSMPFWTLRVEGRERRAPGACILVANHQSRLDSPVMIAIEPGVSGPVRGYMLRVPLIGSLIRLLGFFDTDAGVRASLEAMDRATLRARETGRPLLFYPEGTRSRDGAIGRFRRGAFLAAVDHGLPIQPVLIEGLDAILPPGHLTLQTHHRHIVRIRYLAPIQPPVAAGGRRDAVRALAEEVRATMVEELGKLRSERP
jgi:1-acyl-sn-glycerol-3-phosphate acyltransferase